MINIHQCGGDIKLVVLRLIAARNKNIQGQLIQIALLELEGRRVNEEGMHHIRKYLGTE